MKKCRVYKQLPQGQTGAGIPPWQQPQMPEPYVGTEDPGINAKKAPWQPNMTQDSQQDPQEVPAEKANNFMSWLTNTSAAAQVKDLLKQDMEALSKGFQIGGANEQSGYQSGDYGKRSDINLGYFQAMAANMGDPIEGLADIASGLGAMGVFNSKGKEALNNAGGNGGGGTGGTEQTDISEKRDPAWDATIPNNTDAMPNSGFGSKQPDTFGRNIDQSFGQGNPTQLPAQQPLQGIMSMFAYGGNLPEYQSAGGVSYPGNQLLLDEYLQDQGKAVTPQPPQPNWYTEDFGQEQVQRPQINQPMAKKETINEADYQTASDWEMEQGKRKEFEPGGPDDPFKKAKKKNPFAAAEDKSNAEHQNEAQGAIATMKGVTTLASYQEKRKREEAIKNRMSNVFETHDVQGSDRGDYMANAPGVGGNFRPDELTRMGYNTKIAQSGYEVNDELELSEAEINDLIAQGYQLEYLD